MAGQIRSGFRIPARDIEVEDKPVQTAATWAPKVTDIDGDYLIYTDEENQTKRQGSGLLPEFLGLADAPAESIFRFGKKWGALDLDPEPRPGLLNAERIDAWRDLARELRAIHRLGCQLNAGQPGDEEEWALLAAVRRGRTLNEKLRDGRLTLMSVIRRLVSRAGLQPRLYWDPTAKDWRIDLDSVRRSNLLAILTIQLMIQVANKSGFAICSICKRAYAVEKRPAPGRRSYCQDPKCRTQMWTQYKREQRERKKESG